MRFNPHAWPASNNNFWNPQNIAQRAQEIARRKQEEQQEAEAAQAQYQQAHQQDFMSVVGSALIHIVRGYDTQNRRAEWQDVERDFKQAFPGARPGDLRKSVDTLKREGVLFEVLDTPGLMGTRSSRLYVL